MPYPEFGFSHEQTLMRDSVIGLLERTSPPDVLRELDETYGDPEESYAALAEGGWLALPFAEAHGGLGGSFRDIAVLVEALGYHSLSVSTHYLCSTIFAGLYVQDYAHAEVRDEVLAGIMAGKTRLAVGYTEPDAGSDVAGIKTRAKLDGNHYVVSGQKCFISCAHVADYLMTAVKTDPDAGRKGMSLLLIDTKLPGVEVRGMKSMGRHASRINEVFLDDVRVPATMMLGDENEAWPKMMRKLNLERLAVAAGSAGLCMKAIRVAKDFATERQAFGKDLLQFQAVAHKFADMQMLTQNARLNTYHVADLLDAGQDPVLETTIAKTVASEAMAKVTDLGLQAMGGHGYVAGDMERLFRDARLGPIGGGTSEIMRNVIAWKMMEAYP